MQQFNASSPAVGGNITYNKNYTIHTFTSPDDGNNWFRTFVQLTANVLAVGSGSGGNSSQGLGGNGGDVDRSNPTDVPEKLGWLNITLYPRRASPSKSVSVSAEAPTAASNARASIPHTHFIIHHLSPHSACVTITDAHICVHCSPGSRACQ